MIHHVQLACPPGSEAALRAFYHGVLALDEIPKPAALAARGGQADLVLPETAGRLHPLLARWDPALLPALREALAREAPMHELAEELDATRIGEAELRRFGDPARLLFNVNDPGDLERAGELLHAG